MRQEEGAEKQHAVAGRVVVDSHDESQSIHARFREDVPCKAIGGIGR